MTPIDEQDEIVRRYAAQLSLRRAIEATDDGAARRWLDVAAAIEAGECVRVSDSFAALIASDLFGASANPTTRRLVFEVLAAGVSR